MIGAARMSPAPPAAITVAIAAISGGSDEISGSPATVIVGIPSEEAHVVAHGCLIVAIISPAFVNDAEAPADARG
jgi:hypothetical protein